MDADGLVHFEPPKAFDGRLAWRGATSTGVPHVNTPALYNRANVALATNLATAEAVLDLICHTMDT